MRRQPYGGGRRLRHGHRHGRLDDPLAGGQTQVRVVVDVQEDRRVMRAPDWAIRPSRSQSGRAQLNCLGHRVGDALFPHGEVCLHGIGGIEPWPVGQIDEVTAIGQPGRFQGIPCVARVIARWRGWWALVLREARRRVGAHGAIVAIGEPRDQDVGVVAQELDPRQFGAVGRERGRDRGPLTGQALPSVLAGDEAQVVVGADEHDVAAHVGEEGESRSGLDHLRRWSGRGGEGDRG